MICDFCSAPNPQHLIITVFNGMVGSEGGWAACDTCYALIEDNKRDELKKRSADTFVQKYGQLMPRHMIIHGINGLHDEFWKRRK